MEMKFLRGVKGITKLDRLNTRKQKQNLRERQVKNIRRDRRKWQTHSLSE